MKLNHQMAVNTANSLLPRFQNAWRGDNSAQEALRLAKIQLIYALEQQIEGVKHITFETFAKHACYDVKPTDRRGS